MPASVRTRLLWMRWQRAGLRLALVIVLLAGWWWWRDRHPSATSAPIDHGDERFVARVIDGDTLLLASGERVRLLGVNTPETKHPDRPVEPFGEEAHQFTREMVEGQTVRLEFDRERYDRHGRLLAYVYVAAECLNERLIEAGLSKAQVQYPYSHAMKQRFLKAEATARARQRGLWQLPASAQTENDE